MRYECERCGSIFIVGEQGFFEKGFLTAKPSSKTANKCPCGEGRLIKILDFDTPEQYEVRTGEALPDNFAVYWRFSGRLIGDGYDHVESGWEPLKFDRAKALTHLYRNVYIVVATDLGPPPDDWKPE
jgi:DNA-directed RNA polymerase subunit RPC12/RpoP